MFVISDALVAKYLSPAQAIDAIERAFRAAEDGETDSFPVVRTQMRGGRSVVGVKSGCNYLAGQLGLKIGGFWFDNPERGMDRHQSTVLLVDPETGRPRAVVAGNTLTALRTAAASAVSVRHLARPDANTLAVIGTGRQALAQIAAIATERSLTLVRAWSPTSAHVADLGRAVKNMGLDFVGGETPADAVRNADIVVTVTPARDALIFAADLKPGVHVCAMGSDTVGKRELGADVLSNARIFVDDVTQASNLGECQHLSSERLAEVTSLGAVVLGRATGRASPSDITVFDGTGMALQDLAAAHAVLDAAITDGATPAAF